MIPKCDTCDFVHKEEGADPECRRFPPIPVFRQWGLFPEVKPDWWCGEWRNSRHEPFTAAQVRASIRGGLGT